MLQHVANGSDQREKKEYWTQKQGWNIGYI